MFILIKVNGNYFLGAKAKTIKYFVY